MQGQTIDDIPTAVIEDAAQLVKANSITGNKMNNIDVVYTMWDNLKKTASMDVGQVSFHREKDVRKIRVEKRINETVNRLNKTKTESHPDFQAERERRDASEREDKKKVMRDRRDQEKEAERLRKEQAELRSYASLMAKDNMTTNHDDGNDSDDFMWMQQQQQKRLKIYFKNVQLCLGSFLWKKCVWDVIKEVQCLQRPSYRESRRELRFGRIARKWRF